MFEQQIFRLFKVPENVKLTNEGVPVKGVIPFKILFICVCALDDKVFMKANVVAGMLFKVPEKVKLAKDIVTNSGNDIDDMILKSGCSNEYYKLEECLCDNDRKWSKCQQQVSSLQKCNNIKQKQK